MADVALIRPGCTDFDEQNRIQGALDIPLNTLGREQVDGLIDSMQEVTVEVIYTAPFEPARSTAETIGSKLGIPVKESPGLRNLDHGLWQGLQVEDVRRKYPKVYKQWQESPETVRPPEGETITEVIERVEKALQKPMKRKIDFGIVASEPLATLIGCILKKCDPVLPKSTGAGNRTQCVEMLTIGENGVASENGDTANSEKAAVSDPIKKAGVSARGENAQ